MVTMLQRFEELNSREFQQRNETSEIYIPRVGLNVWPTPTASPIFFSMWSAGPKILLSVTPSIRSASA
ncbi:hypothetical protein EA703_15710 [Acinetobacter baumannii]|nr:hypothetical protein EA703_15710 [Acinetobacter baumannii]